MRAELITIEDKLTIISDVLTENEILLLRAGIDLNEDKLHRITVWGLSYPNCSDNEVIKGFVAITLTIQKLEAFGKLTETDYSALINDRSLVASILLERHLLELPIKSNYYTRE